MPALSSAMTTLRKAFLAVVAKQLLRGKSLLQAILAFWLGAPVAVGGKPTRTLDRTKPATIPLRPIEEFLEEAERLLLGPLTGDGMHTLSQTLKTEFRHALQTAPISMLPSYNHQLPKGHEVGRYLALDVGGSTLRVALVELRGRDAKGREGEILSLNSFKIDQDIKNLEGMAFFEWMADRMLETISSQGYDRSRPMPMALAWSFPIAQSSLKGGTLLDMGKGFLAADGLLGQDLGQVIKMACKSKGFDIALEAIINDGSAALLSEAYTNPTTRFSLILGTGVNISAYLPVSSVGRAKFGDRGAEWFDAANHVVVNTELGMFGGDGLSVTRWDRQLKAGHPRPDFQPLEQMVSGMYLGEVARFVLIEAIQTTGIFGGQVPKSLIEPYTLSTETLSVIESDSSPTLSTAIQTFASRHPASHAPTKADLAALKGIASLVSRRSSAIIATSIYTLWDLRLESVAEFAETLPTDAEARADAVAEMGLERTVVAFNGSVVEQYPGYLGRCQAYIDELVSGKRDGVSVALVAAKESSLLGAAVALACACDSEAHSE